MCVLLECPDYFYPDISGERCLQTSCPDFYYVSKSGSECLQVECDLDVYEIDISGLKCNKKKTSQDFFLELPSIDKCSGEFIGSESKIFSF